MTPEERLKMIYKLKNELSSSFYDNLSLYFDLFNKLNKVEDLSTFYPLGFSEVSRELKLTFPNYVPDSFLIIRNGTCYDSLHNNPDNDGNLENFNKEIDCKNIFNYHKNIKDFATLAVSDRESSRKLLFNDELVLRGWLNVQTGEQRLAEFNKGFKALAFSGVHCINPVIFDKIKRTGKFSVMEEYLDLMQTEKIHGFVHDSVLIDVGRPESVTEAEKYFK